MTAVSQGYENEALLILRLPEELQAPARKAWADHENASRHLAHMLDGEPTRDGCEGCKAEAERDRYKAALERISDYEDDSVSREEYEAKYGPHLTDDFGDFDDFGNDMEPYAIARDALAPTPAGEGAGA